MCVLRQWRQGYDAKCGMQTLMYQNEDLMTIIRLLCILSHTQVSALWLLLLSGIALLLQPLYAAPAMRSCSVCIVMQHLLGHQGRWLPW